MCSYQASVFLAIFPSLGEDHYKPETIINGFKKTGVCPLNKAAISIVPNLTPDDNMSPLSEPCSSLAASMSPPCSSLAANMSPQSEPCSLAANPNMMSPPCEPSSSLAANMSPPSEPCSLAAKPNMTPPNEPCSSLAANI